MSSRWRPPQYIPGKLDKLSKTPFTIRRSSTPASPVRQHPFAPATCGREEIHRGSLLRSTHADTRQRIVPVSIHTRFTWLPDLPWYGLCGLAPHAVQPVPFSATQQLFTVTLFPFSTSMDCEYRSFLRKCILEGFRNDSR